MSANPLVEPIARVRERIARAARAAGRDSAAVRLVAVSKFHSAASIRLAYEAGVRDFGENYAQELVAKAAELSSLSDLSWHMIGHLQSNKARSVAPVVSAVHTLDSAKLAAELARRADAAARTIDVLVEVNVAGEASKSGCSPEAVPDLLNALASLPSLRPRGLMTMPPYDPDPERGRDHFRALRQLRDSLGRAGALPELSMGMSHDLEVAISEGATMVRVGTAIFGERPR